MIKEQFNINILSNDPVFSTSVATECNKFGFSLFFFEEADIKSEKKSQYLVDHLKGEDFYFVEKHPTAILKIISAASMPDNLYKVAADLTIKGITNRITFAAHLTVKKDGFLGTANIKIDRTKWDIVYKSGSIFKELGDKLIYDEIEFDIFLLSVK